jgi:hypothetical protein
MKMMGGSPGESAKLRVLASAASSTNVTDVSTHRFDIAVIGAGVFGAWTAWHLQQLGNNVVLLDAHGPGRRGHSPQFSSSAIRSETIFTAMDMRLALAAYVLPSLAIVFGIPMVLGLIPPNPYYGYRTRKTFSSTDTWYRANRIAGWSLLVAGTLALCHNFWLQHDHPGWPSATKQLIMTVSASLLLFLGLIITGFYVRKL